MTYETFQAQLHAAESLSDFDAFFAMQDPSAAEGLFRFLFLYAHDPSPRCIRSALGMTQEAFAEAFHLPLQLVERWESGASAPRYVIDSIAYSVINKLPR